MNLRIAHLADLHIGLRRFDRVNPGGPNVREADVLTAFRVAVDRILTADVQVVLIAGDVFDGVRPPNGAILGLYAQLARFSSLGIDTVLIGGNHDTPRSSDTQNILMLFAKLPHVHVVVGKPGAVRIGDLHVACVPHVHGDIAGVTLEPDQDARWNVALAHLPFSPGMVLPWNASDFHYSALGDFHVAHELESGVWYPGSLEYVSTNPWGEQQEERARGRPGKGFLLVELGPEWPRVEFQPIPTRAHIDLPPIDVGTWAPVDVDRMLFDHMNQSLTEGAVVRQVLCTCPRGFVRQLNHEAIRAYKTRALHYQLVEVRPERQARSLTPGTVARAYSLADVVREMLDKRSLSDDVDRVGLQLLAEKYMADEPDTANPAAA